MSSPNGLGRQYSEHRGVFTAPPEVLYDLIADVSRWPVIFQPSIHVHIINYSAERERFRIWAMTNDRVSSWTSARVRDRESLQICFEQEQSSPPLTSMNGSWQFIPLADGGTEIVLRHDYTVEADRNDALDWVRSALDTNSTTELGALRAVAGMIVEAGCGVDAVAFSFEDWQKTTGTPRRAYEFVRAADRWPEHLPHVRQVRLTEDADVQDMEMSTVTEEGVAHATRSTRILFPHESIAYKQSTLPKLLLGHSGRWSFEQTAAEAVISSRHTVLLNTVAIPEVLGVDTTTVEAKEHVRQILGANSRATMAFAAQAAEGRL